MRSHRKMFRVAALCLAMSAVATPAQAGVRADLSGNAAIDFQTTMDMPLMTWAMRAMPMTQRATATVEWTTPTESPISWLWRRMVPG